MKTQLPNASRRREAPAKIAPQGDCCPGVPELRDTIREMADILPEKPLYASTKTLIRDFAVAVDQHFPAPQQERIFEAARLALILHLPQAPRVGGTPMVNHIVQVPLNLMELIKAKFAEMHTTPAPNQRIAQERQTKLADLVIAALLHDSVEDQAEALARLHPNASRLPATKDPQEIKRRALETLKHFFGEHVSSLVAKLTNADFKSKAEALLGEKGHEGKNALVALMYQRHVMELAEGHTELDREAFSVKMADFWDNALRHGELPTETQADRDLKFRLTCKRDMLMRCLILTLPSLPANHPIYGARMELRDKIDRCYRKDYLGMNLGT